MSEPTCTARLQHKVALVTGGASGLGKAIAQRLAAEGARVAIGDVQIEAGQALASEAGLLFIQQDVSDEAQWTAVVGQVERHFGRLDILINNAGILGQRQFVDPENTPFADWKKIFAINVDSVFLGCRAAIAAMKKVGGGSIVNISSVAGLTATPYATAYGASKATVRQLTQSIAQHCAERKLNIRCNSVHPGDVLTPLWMRHAQESAQLTGVAVDKFIAAAEAAVPLGRLTKPEDIAAAVAFLVSDDARQITGVPLVVDGGFVHCDTYRAGLDGSR